MIMFPFLSKTTMSNLLLKPLTLNPFSTAMCEAGTFRSLCKNEIIFCLTHSSAVNNTFFFRKGSKIYLLLLMRFIL